MITRPKIKTKWYSPRSLAIALYRLRKKKKSGFLPDYLNLLAWYKRDIQDGRLQAYRPLGSSTPQVKGSLFTTAGTGAVTGLLTTDTITSSGTAPTCSVDGTLTISAACWDIYVHRAGVLWAYWPGINVGGTFELDASGEGNTLYLTDTAITERVDGTGTNWANDAGFTIADGTSQWLEETHDTIIGAGWRIPAILGSTGESASWSVGYDPLMISGEALSVDSEILNIGT